MASYSISSGVDSITVVFSGVGGYYYRVFCYANGNTSGPDLGGGWTYSSTYTATKVISGLSTGTQYLLSIYIANSSSGANANQLGKEYVTPSAPSVTAYYDTGGITQTSFTFNVYGVAGAASYWKYFRAFVSLNGVQVYSSSWTQYTSNFSVTASGLNAGTTYTISVYTATSSSGANATALSGPSSVTTSKNQIALWSWSASNGSATNYQTQAAYTAISNNGKMTNFSYLVWNDLCAKVNECIAAAGSTWWTNMGPSASATPSYDSTLMSSSDKTLTAARFNALRGNVSGRVSTGINPVSPGEKVYGSYFATLVDSLNSWIANLNG